MHLSFWSGLIFTIYHSFCVCHNFLGLIGKKLSEGKGRNKFVPRLYYRWYLNDTPNGDNDINDNDDENHINDNNNNDHNHHNDHSDDDNDKNYDNDNGAQTIMIL